MIYTVYILKRRFIYLLLEVLDISSTNLFGFKIMKSIFEITDSMAFCLYTLRKNAVIKNKD
ncbi:hypothetical protein BCT52_15440 [Vibrio breoganii]|nr:hypothetical protein BCT52_15440 [Vibrio breoganii]